MLFACPRLHDHFLQLVTWTLFYRVVRTEPKVFLENHEERVFVPPRVQDERQGDILG